MEYPIPHVFTADHFELRTPSESLIQANGVKVLLMHGFPKDGRWFPLNEKLRDKDISIEDLVKSFEAQSGETIDVLFVCNQRPTTRVRAIPFSSPYEQARIFMKEGNASGGITINEKTGEVTVRMDADNKDNVNYSRWKNRGRVKVNYVLNFLSNSILKILSKH